MSHAEYADNGDMASFLTMAALAVMSLAVMSQRARLCRVYDTHLHCTALWSVIALHVTYEHAMPCLSSFV